MKRVDIFPPIILLAFFSPFILSEQLYQAYSDFYASWPFLTSYLKFAFLATGGELIGLRIRSGSYYEKGFGLIPRAIIWGFLGMTIQAAFLIFAAGVPGLLSFVGITNASELLAGELSIGKVLVAFSISTFLNIFYAPVLMTLHKITDTHISNTGGTIRGLFSKMDITSILKRTDWEMLWGFVIKKTIPIFWIPAQTINFLMPEEFRVLIAALYGIVLGIILAFAAKRKDDF